MTLPMAGMPAVISQSVADVLRAHGYVIARRVPTTAPVGVPMIAVELGPDEAAEVIRECGRNTTQALFVLDEPRYELGYGSTFKLRKAWMEHNLSDADLLSAICRLERGDGTPADIADLCHLAELADLPWRELFPDVFESAASPPSGAVVEERDGAEAPPPPSQPAPSRSVCTPLKPGDAIAAGHTLRALAQQNRPNAQTAEVLGRVGDWLVEVAPQ